jgi:hypothetical protein
MGSFLAQRPIQKLNRPMRDDEPSHKPAATMTIMSVSLNLMNPRVCGMLPAEMQAGRERRLPPDLLIPSES